MKAAIVSLLHQEAPSLRSMGVMPTHKDLWGRDPPALEDVFASTPIGDWMEVLTRIASVDACEAANPKERTAAIRELFPPNVQQSIDRFLKLDRNSVLLDRFPVLLTMELAAIQASRDNQSQNLTRKTVETVLKGVYAVWERLNLFAYEDIAKSPAGILAALFERSSLGSVPEHLRTAYGCWVWKHPYCDEKVAQIRAGFANTLHTHYKLSLEEWLAASAMILSCLVPEDLDRLLAGESAVTPPFDNLTHKGNASIQRALKALSTDLPGFMNTCQQQHMRAPLLERPSLLPIKRHPVIQVTDRPPTFRIISPIHLAEAALERPVRLDEQRRTEFGVIFESYVHALLRTMFGDRYQPLLPAQGRKRAEAILWYAEGFIVVECKARRVAEDVRYGARTDTDYLRELVRGDIRKAVEQVQHTIQDTLRGEIRAPWDINPHVVGALIICFQEVPRVHAAKSVLEGILPPTHRADEVLHLRAQLMSIGELAELDGWAHHSLLDVLTAKMQNDRFSFESLRNYLFYQHGLGRGFQVRSALADGLMKLAEAWLTTHLE